jgi:hypothetical protein
MAVEATRGSDLAAYLMGFARQVRVNLLARYVADRHIAKILNGHKALCVAQIAFGNVKTILENSESIEIFEVLGLQHAPLCQYV